jgi:hypothetical protein
MIMLIESNLPVEEFEAVKRAVGALFAAMIPRLKPRDAAVLAEGLARGLLRPRFALEADDSALGEVILPNGEKVVVFQKVSAAALARDILN